MVREIQSACQAPSLASILALVAGLGCAEIPRSVQLIERLPEEESCARLVLADVEQSLAVDRATRLTQTRAPDRAPLQLFPRLVAPAFVEPLEAARCGELGWLLPVLFDSREGSSAHAQPTKDLSFWLEKPRGAGEGRFVPLNDKLFFTDLLDWDGRAIQAAVFRIPTDAVDPGFFWLRILPRLSRPAEASADEGGPQECLGLCRIVSEGDLREAFENDARPPATEGQAASLDLLVARLGCSPLRCRHPYRHFWPSLERLQKGLKSFLKATRQASPRSSQIWSGEIRAALRDLYAEDRSPAAVKLGDPDPSEEPLRFIAAADFQERGDMTRVRQFLGLIDPCFPRRLDADLRDKEHLRFEIREAEFVLLAGDLADAEASSRPLSLVANFLGLMPPRSPYEAEYATLKELLRAFAKPFVAVPGNHDGYVGYAGILNLPFSLFPETDRVNDWIPVLFKPPFPRPIVGRLSRPRYDGLQEWRYALGPVSYTFRYQGHLFSGLNTYNLEPAERSSVGAVVFNWGGGVRPDDLEALDASLTHFAEQRNTQREFYFMHHDPRGSFPKEDPPEIDRYGLYDEIDTVASYLTLGHFGIGHSPHWDMYIPVLTPLVHQASRLLEGLLSGRHRIQQEWMRRSFRVRYRQEDVGEHYGAEGLTRLIDERRSSKAGEPGAAAIFLGHDNHALSDEWADPNQQGAVFPRMPWEEWKGLEFHDEFNGFRIPYGKRVSRALVKLRNDEPPSWAQGMWGRSAQNIQVHRLDDVGDSSDRGFALVRVPRDPQAPIDVEHIEFFDPGTAPIASRPACVP